MTELLTHTTPHPGIELVSGTGDRRSRSAGERREGVARRMEGYRPGLTAHCRRMLGSAFEADDAVQETMVRAWRSYERFEGRASMKSWLHRIATNVCFDMLKAPQRRARPTDATVADEAGPVALGPPPVADPAEQVVGRDDVRLALVAALLHLPPRQRSVLLLCEVLRWRASEVAELLDTSVASVNSSLQRARATLSERQGDAAAGTGAAAASRVPALDDDQQALLGRYTAAFASSDVTSLVALLR